MATKRGGRAYYMISAVAQRYNIHPQTLRLYEREGLLKPSRTEGNAGNQPVSSRNRRLETRSEDVITFAAFPISTRATPAGIRRGRGAPSASATVARYSCCVTGSSSLTL